MKLGLDGYRDAKFGLFIHWGAYSVAGVEASWSMMAPDLSEAMFGTPVRISEAEYITLPQRFNPVNFDADQWVKIAQDAGMRYMVLTAKHHDGFCMFDAPGTEYKITNTSYGKDICLELAQACARAGMPLGFYYSPPDMHHPGYRDTRKPVTQNWTGEPKRKEWVTYLDYMESHLRKLLTEYGDVALIWFDALANHGKYDPPRFHQLIRELSPNTLINDRMGDGFDFVTPEQFIPKAGIPARTGKPPAGMDPGGDGFFRTVDSLFKVPVVRDWIRKQMQKYSDGTMELTPVHQEPYPSPDRFQPWETCMTMGQTWAYNPEETRWKDSSELLRNLVRVVSRGGNYLLNVGPAPDGTFPPEAIERLQQVGGWMKQHNEAIYGTTYTPLQGQDWGQATRKGNKVYLHLFDWNTAQPLVITDFPGKVRSVSLFSSESLEYSQAEGHLEITVTKLSPDAVMPVLIAEIDSTEPGWNAYSAPVITTMTPKEYIKKQAVSSALINAILNGVLAFFSYRSRGEIPYAEAAIDILITVAIITLINAWLFVGSTRQAIMKGDLVPTETTGRRWKLPKSAGLLAFLIMLVCVILFGGVVLDGLLYLVTPAGLSGWAYLVLKTIYTGAAAALAVAVAIWVVIKSTPTQNKDK